MYKIAICGKKNSGKNTLSNFIVQNLKLKLFNFGLNKFEYESAAFADPIKEMLTIAFPTARVDHLYGPSHLREEPIDGIIINGKPLTYRQALIDLGSNYYGRNYYPSMWLDVMSNKIECFQKSGNCNVFIINDLRFINEFELVKKHNFTTIKIIRNDSLEKHASETEQDSIPFCNFDYICNNISSLTELEIWSKFLVDKIMEKYVNNN